MLRFKILASAVPLVAAALFARGGLLPGPHPCIAIASASVEIADLPWRADLHLASTDDPPEPTVRVQVPERAEAAAVAHYSDVHPAETGFRQALAAPRAVAI